jgi:cytochrome c-type biogenesis protein CcmE
MNTVVKLAFAATLITGLTVYMGFRGASAGWKYYLTVDECLQHRADLLNQRIRLSGSVAEDSLEISPDRRRAQFRLCGASAVVPVRCVGRIPDNLAERIDVVIEGRLDDSGDFQAFEILTRCASKYAPQSPPPETSAGPCPEENGI